MSRDEQILSAAEKLFFERSFDGVGVDEIGRAAGTSGSAIYRHFASKDAILAALFDKVLDTLLVRIGEPDPDPDADLAKLMRAFAGLVDSHERLFSIWLREQRSLAERYRRDHDRRQQRVTERWVGCLRRRYPEASLDDVITATRGLQLLLLSQALRPPGGRSARHPEDLLVRMGLASLQALEPVRATS
ncbi:TetR family transcriptional regulator [Mycolicibacterium moriokaense]|uniref:TetR family transcriptional regulator n=1 Tax=Mycolicibacterium moriokaense TaxID=39691 RepID=A0AAD1H7W6_9MYCO|nr:TetR/AcrR family transcriptional regulator [Mycolicibacterium moriokaense]ORB18533.1 TetR family transcriptional regulator [Mycolicibacterium moriokaense]BBX00089.1 TetR family transcriptional regulator [Mycolicibacterium moriokaense]